MTKQLSNQEIAAIGLLAKQFGRTDTLWDKGLNAHIRVGLVTERGTNAVFTATPSTGVDGNAFTIGMVNAANLKNEQYVIFQVTLLAYIHGEITHSVLATKGWTEQKTPFYVGVRGAAGARETIVMSRTGKNYFRSTVFEKQAQAAMRVIEGLIVRVQKHNKPEDSRMGVVAGKLTAYGQWCLQEGKRGDQTLQDWREGKNALVDAVNSALDAKHEAKVSGDEDAIMAAEQQLEALAANGNGHKS